MALLRDKAQVEAHFGPLGDSANLDVDRCMVCLDIVLILTQDRRTVCAECTIGSEIVLDANNGTPR